MTLSRQQSVRLGHDVAAVAVALLLSNTLQGAQLLLLFMQVVTISFHMTYIAFTIKDESWLTSTNNWKWAEYAIGATLGTLAVLDDAPLSAPRSTLFAVATLSVTQQWAGYLLEKTKSKRWLLWAWAAQVGIIGTVLTYTTTSAAIFYCVSWSAFGAIGTYDAFDTSTDRLKDKRAWIEAMYGVLGWTAKGGLYWLSTETFAATESDYLVGAIWSLWAGLVCVTAVVSYP